MRKLEIQPRHTQPDKNISNGLTRRGNANYLTREDKNNLYLYDKQLRLKAKEQIKLHDERITAILNKELERVKNDPKSPPLLDTWNSHITGQQQIEADLAARGEKYTPILPIQQQPYETLNPEMKKYRNFLTTQALGYELSEEAKEAQFDGMAKEIQKRMWNDNPFNLLAIQIKPTHELNIDIKDDGTIINRSGSGVTISYTHKDIQKLGIYKENITLQEEALTFGIRYVTDRKYLAEEAKDAISDEKLENGIKSYFVQRTRTIEKNGKAETQTDMIAIPLGYATTENEEVLTFYKYLYNAAKSIEPETVLPQAKERVKTYRRAA